MNTIIRINRVSKCFGDVLAVKNLSFSLGKGNIMGIVGPNGAGKSTLINLLSGVYKPDTGQLFYYDQPFTDNAVDLKKRLGILPEKLGMFEQLRGEEYLYFIARFYGVPEKVTQIYMKELFHFMNMEDDKGKYIHQYSKGMKKKISLAAVLIHSPEIVIMDEPFENIDPIALKNISETIKKMKQQGSTFIITSQILHSLEKLCSDILIIDKGKNILFDKISSIQSDMRQRLKERQNSYLEQLFFDIMKTRDSKKTLSWV
jgi:ABC-2 type transport system ATP-binding protein